MCLGVEKRQTPRGPGPGSRERGAISAPGLGAVLLSELSTETFPLILFSGGSQLSGLGPETLFLSWQNLNVATQSWE